MTFYVKTVKNPGVQPVDSCWKPHTPVMMF
nr:MAG TPA: hypothetical protein [Caudoviricetes sp.]